VIYELLHCPFDPGHVRGSAAFTVVNGKPGFRCQHDGCRGKSIQDVFALYPANSSKGSVGSDSATAEGKSKTTQSQLVIEITADAELFHTPAGEAFAVLPVGNHQEVWPLKSVGCRRWLMRAFYQKFGKPPSTQAMQDAVALLEAKAHFDSPASDVYTRIASHGQGSIYVDLCNERWEAVEITAQGWRVVQKPPVRFRRSRGMRALPLPSPGGSISMLRRLINIGDDKNWILLLSWLIAAFRPRGPYPVLILQGEQGSAKSTTAKFLWRLIDPVAAPLRTPPREERDLLIAANNSWVVAYDNVSGIPHWLSDALCRLATGGGFSTRELYSDTEEVILDLTRPAILNGIDHLAERPDLADRAIILQLPRIKDEIRRDEEQLYAEYGRDQPQILGALFTAISAALDRLPKVRLSCKPRMADFAVWSTASESGLGLETGAFMDAYATNRVESVNETLESDPISTAILLRFNHATTDWNGTMGDFLKDLNRDIEDSIKRSPGWPKTPRALSNRIRRLASFLRESGIEITFHQRKGTGGQRLFTIARTARNLTASTATTAADEPDASMIQPHRDDAAGGGGNPGVADEPHRGDQPPLRPPPVIRSLAEQEAIMRRMNYSPGFQSFKHSRRSVDRPGFSDDPPV
jgi:hypothetical protein